MLNKIEQFFSRQTAFLFVLVFLYMYGVAWAANTALSGLTADTAPTSDDLVLTTNDPGGTPASRKVTLENLPKAFDGDTQRGNMGLGTGDSPQFTGVEIGHATDTTLTRTAAGAVAVEGTAVQLAGDVLQTDSSTTLPGTCTTGQTYVDTDADTDGSLYICVTTDTWKEVDDDGIALAGTDTYNCFMDGATPACDDAGFTYNKTTDTITVAGGVNITATANGGQLSYWYEDTDNGTNYIGWGSPASNNNDLILLAPTSDPLAGQIPEFAAPTSVTGADNVARDSAQMSWNYKNKILTSAKTSAYTVGTDDAEECYGGTIYVSSAATVTACDNLAAGMNFCVKTVGAIAVHADVQADDLQILDGTALDDGDRASNTSTAGDTICFEYYDATGWWSTSGSPDGDKWTDGS